LGIYDAIKKKHIEWREEFEGAILPASTKDAFGGGDFLRNNLFSN